MASYLCVCVYLSWSNHRKKMGEILKNIKDEKMGVGGLILFFQIALWAKFLFKVRICLLCIQCLSNIEGTLFQES